MVESNYSNYAIIYYFVDKVKWIQPVLTSDTSSIYLKTSTNSVYNTSNTNTMAWRSFEANDTDSSCWCSTIAMGSSAYLQLQFDKPLNINKITVKNRSTTYSFTKGYKLQGSNLGSVWEDLYTGENNNFTGLGIWTLYNSTKPNVYKYIRINSTSTQGEGYACIGSVTIDANYGYKVIL